MKRVLVVAGLLLATATAFAADDPIAARKALMKETGKQAGAGASMIKGETPFDLDKAKAILATFENTAAKAPTLFPDTAKTGGETAALPAIWDNKADFESRFTKLGGDAKAAQGTVTDLASFKTAFGVIGKDCGGCHEQYREKKQ